MLQFDLWEPAREIPVGHGQTRKGYVVICCLGYSRAGAGALVFSKQLPDLLAGISRCLVSLGGLPKLLVWDRQSGLHAHRGQPTCEVAAFCGQTSLPAELIIELPDARVTAPLAPDETVHALTPETHVGLCDDRAG